jgi:hypothetical protein
LQNGSLRIVATDEKEDAKEQLSYELVSTLSGPIMMPDRQRSTPPACLITNAEPWLRAAIAPAFIEPIKNP